MNWERVSKPFHSVSESADVDGDGWVSAMVASADSAMCVSCDVVTLGVS